MRKLARQTNTFHSGTRQVDLSPLQTPRPSIVGDSLEHGQRASIVRGAIPNPNAYIVGYDRPNWLGRVYELWGNFYREYNKPYDSSLDAIERVHPGTSAPLGPQSWVSSINQVNIPRNRFNWHPVPELINLPVAGGSPQQVQQQYVMVQSNEQITAQLANATRIAHMHAPASYGNPIPTVSDSGVLVRPLSASTLSSVQAQAASGSNFFTWLAQKIKEQLNNA